MGAFAILGIISQIAVTLIGFTGVFFAVGQFSRGGLKAKDRTAFIHLLIPATVALMLSLICLVASSTFESSSGFWRCFNLLLVCIHVCTIFDVTKRTLRKEVSRPLLQGLMLAIGYLMILGNLLAAFGLLASYSTLFFLAGVTWLLIVSVVQFIFLVFSLTNEANPNI